MRPPENQADFDTAGVHDVSQMRSQADRCRRLAASVADLRAEAALRSLAQSYDEKAKRLSGG